MEQAWEHALRIFSIDVRFALNISANSMDKLAFNFSQKKAKINVSFYLQSSQEIPWTGRIRGRTANSI
jgi:hypothetical protein